MGNEERIRKSGESGDVLCVLHMMILTLPRVKDAVIGRSVNTTNSMHLREDTYSIVCNL